MDYLQTSKAEGVNGTLGLIYITEVMGMGWEYHNRQRKEDGTWRDRRKAARISVRVSFMERELIRGRAYARSMSVSEYILFLVEQDRHRAAEPVSCECVPTVEISTGDRQLSRAAKRRQAPLTACRQYN